MHALLPYTETRMANRCNRWVRRWLILIMVWAIPILIITIREIRIEMAYNNADRQQALTTWQLTNAQRAAGAAAYCHGNLDMARAAGCPAIILAANAPRQQAARDEYRLRQHTLASYLWHAFIGYWIVPAVILYASGLLIVLIRRLLRRPTAVTKTLQS